MKYYVSGIPSSGDYTKLLEINMNNFSELGCLYRTELMLWHSRL